MNIKKLWMVVIMLTIINPDIALGNPPKKKFQNAKTLAFSGNNASGSKKEGPSLSASPNSKIRLNNYRKHFPKQTPNSNTNPSKSNHYKTENNLFSPDAPESTSNPKPQIQKRPNNKDNSNNINQEDEANIALEAINEYIAQQQQIMGLSANDSSNKPNNASFTDDATSSSVTASAIGAKNNIAIRTRAIRLGLASGEAIIKYGLWGQIEAGSAKQRQASNIAAYRLTQTVLSFGGDAEINDNTLFGLAYSRALSKSKDLLGNKSDHQAHIISLYNSVDLIHHISVTSMLNFGIGQIKKTRNSGIANVTANPKTQIFGASSELEYLHKISPEHNIIYSLGCDYDMIRVKSYQEKGDSKLVLNFAKKTKDNLQFIGGLMFQNIQNMGKSKILTMEVHGKYNHSLSNKNKLAKVVHASSGQLMPLENHKVNKSKIILGGSLNLIKNNKYEISSGYDFARGKAYNEHSGYLKFKVNF